MEVLKNQRPVLRVFGVYLPHDSHCSQSLESYLQNLCELQSYIDKGDATPTIVVGDFNTRLPQVANLPLNWAKCKGFNKQSALLYDFICDNDFYVANFAFQQSIQYTYSNCKNKSYIDHMLLPMSLFENTLACTIMDSSTNVSDHKALTCTITLDVLNDSTCQSNSDNSRSREYSRVDWSDARTRENYKQAVQAELSKTPIVTPDDITSKSKAEVVINDIYINVCNAIRAASKSVAEVKPSNHKKVREWWNPDCGAAKKRMSLFYKIWKQMGKPSSGQAFLCYRESRKHYRKKCRHAMNGAISAKHKLISKLFRTNRHREFWNLIAKCKSERGNPDAISVQALEDHFTAKFTAPDRDTDYTKYAKLHVEKKMESLRDTTFTEVFISEARVWRQIKNMKAGASAGVDDISPEHLKNSDGSSLGLHLSSFFTLCFRFSILPVQFYTGLLIPIIKKRNLDPSDASNYRPITVSVALSKVLEMIILEDLSDKALIPCDPLQFGFISKRSCNSAITLAHDVSSYCKTQGSSTFLCSLDAEGAFDAIPHAVLFTKAEEVLQPAHWCLMYTWYRNMSVKIRWNAKNSSPIAVRRGTRQGGLTSPLLFNLFYRDLINQLRTERCGIIINDSTYNVFCYADDLLLSSTTPSGLQRLINVASNYIVQHGLRFNPQKTTCMIYGDNPFTDVPSLSISNENLKVTNSLTYLGAGLAQDGGASHALQRTKAATNAFYKLQHAGLYHKGVCPSTAAHLFKVGIQTSLTYAIESIHINASNLNLLKRTQGNLIKAALGLRKSCRTTPLLRALNIQSVTQVLELSLLNLFKSCLISDSATSTFYSYICSKSAKHYMGTIIDRIKSISSSHPIRYSLDQNYCSRVRIALRANVRSGADGLVDSLRDLFSKFDNRAKDLVNLLVGSI